MKKKIANETTRVFCFVLITVIFIFLDASCRAEQLVQKSVFDKNKSKPDYVLTLERGDYKSAIEEMRSLAQKGDPYAQYNLGLLYYKGTAGLTQNYKEAEKLWRKAAQQGILGAQSDLAAIYGMGKGVPQNYQESAKWYRKAAEQNLANAQYNLGYYYEKALGVVKDYKEAAKWYRKAAEQDDVVAQFNLGRMYEEGKGVSRDYHEALKLYRTATAKGAIRAQIVLGFMYLEGKGVSRDLVQGYKWIYIAAETGDPTAKESIAFASKCVTQSQIAEAISLAKEEKITKIDVFKAFEK